MESEDTRPYGRRAFLGVLGAGVTSLWWGDPVYRGLSDVLSPITDKAPAALRAAVPAPGSGWRIYAVNPPMPRFDPATWRLTVDGLVDQPLTLDLDGLKALPRTEMTADFHCVTGWSVEDVRWAGVRLSDLFERVGPRSGAGGVNFVSMEKPYVDSLTLDQAMREDAMLAYEMDGAPLTRPHGAPVRLVMPAMYGYKGVKWMQQMTLTRRAEVGYWEERGYDADAWVGGSNGYG